MDLDHPPTSEALYLYRGKEVSAVRPLMQGDVFTALVDEPPEAVWMAVTHPCSMRQGPSLRERLTVVEVTDYPRIPLRKWADGHYDVMPLPDLPCPDRPGPGVAADFRLIRTVPTTSLLAAQRFACLSEDGIQLLQQRLVFHLTRVHVDLATLYEHSAPVLVEAELEEEWVAAALAAGTTATAEQPLIEREAGKFQDFLGAGSGSLRERLQEARTRAHVRREVRKAIAQRFAAQD